MTAFPHIWVPRRELWRPPMEWFTAGKAQRKSDGKLPRKVSTGTAGKTPRNTTGTTCCCTTPLTVCPCNGTTGTYNHHLTLVVSGISIPLNTCLYACGSITGNSIKISSFSPNGTFCLSYVSGGTLGGGPCIFTFTDSSAASFLLDGSGGLSGTPCVSPLTGLLWHVDLNVTTFTVARVFIFFNSSGLTFPAFDSGAIAVSLGCGGTSASISNASTYCTSQPGPNVGTTAISGSVTVQDGGC